MDRHHINRNALCPCHSGARYKHCCGAAAGNPPKGSRHEGLALHERGELLAALDIYGAWLRFQPDDWDVAHMHAVALYQLGLINEARTAFAELLASPAVDLPGFWTNLGLLFAACFTAPLAGGRPQPAKRLLAPSPTARPTISVVMPTYNHAAYIAEAVASVLEQTLPPLELIIIDDGSRDSTVAECRQAIASATLPVKLIARDNRGAPSTLNQAIDMACGEFIQILNSDDRLPAERLRIMLSRLEEAEADWGFSRVSYIDPAGTPLAPDRYGPAQRLRATQDSVAMAYAPSLNFLVANAAISSGNLTFRKALWHHIGGFRDFRYNHDWDFCLRASLFSDPVLLGETLYEYRLHDHNTINEDTASARVEFGQVMAGFLADAQRQSWPNSRAPTLANWGNDYLALLGASDNLRHLPRSLIRQVLASEPSQASLR